VGIVISTDMTHYEPAELARVKDWKAIGKMEALDGEGSTGSSAKRRSACAGTPRPRPGFTR